MRSEFDQEVKKFKGQSAALKVLEEELLKKDVDIETKDKHLQRISH